MAQSESREQQTIGKSTFFLGIILQISGLFGSFTYLSCVTQHQQCNTIQDRDNRKLWESYLQLSNIHCKRWRSLARKKLTQTRIRTQTMAESCCKFWSIHMCCYFTSRLKDWKHPKETWCEFKPRGDTVRKKRNKKTTIKAIAK